jgi:opacity protein-like surface antigen
MKRFLTQSILAGLCLAFLATPASAQGGLMLGGGLTMPQGDFGDGVKSGVHGMAAFDFAVLGAPLGVRVDGSYHLNYLDLPGDPDAAANIIAIGGDAVYTFPSVGAKPYVVGGITWASLKCSGDDCLNDESESATGFNVGGGVRFGGIFAEAKYVSIGGDLDIKYVPITVGFHF